MNSSIVKIAAALLAAAFLSAPPQFSATAQTKAPAKAPEFLFVQTAKDIAYKDGVLTLQDVRTSGRSSDGGSGGPVTSLTPSTLCGDVLARKSMISPLASAAQIHAHSRRSASTTGFAGFLAQLLIDAIVLVGVGRISTERSPNCQCTSPARQSSIMRASPLHPAMGEPQRQPTP
jgi:hypothetical protein